METFEIQGKPSSHSYFSHRLRLHFLDWGNVDADNMVLVHGIHDHCHAWDWMADHFRHKHHVVAPDLRGHGDSEWSKGGTYALTDNVYDLYQLVKQQDLAPLTLVSHSLGGTISSLYAGLYPDTVDKLVIIEGVGLYPWNPNIGSRQLLRGWIESGVSMAGRSPRKYLELNDAIHRMESQNPHLSPEQAAYLTNHGTYQNEDGSYSWKFDNYTRLRTIYDVPHDDMCRAWEAITCPVLILNSDNGYPHRIGQDRTDQYFEDLHMETIVDASHWTHHDQLVEVQSKIDDFL